MFYVIRSKVCTNANTPLPPAKKTPAVNRTNTLAGLQFLNFSVKITVLWDLQLSRWVSSRNSLTLKIEAVR